MIAFVGCEIDGAKTQRRANVIAGELASFGCAHEAGLLRMKNLRVGLARLEKGELRLPEPVVGSSEKSFIQRFARLNRCGSAEARESPCGEDKFGVP
jgi:hypothetical protein